MDGLFQRHKPAAGFRVRDGNGPALGDLPQENRDHAACRSDHVTEADCIHAACGSAERDHSQLPQTFRNTHDAMRIHRFIGGDQDQRGRPMAARRCGERVRTDCIVLNSRNRMALK